MGIFRAGKTRVENRKADICRWICPQSIVKNQFRKCRWIRPQSIVENRKADIYRWIRPQSIVENKFQKGRWIRPQSIVKKQMKFSLRQFVPFMCTFDGFATYLPLSHQSGCTSKREISRSVSISPSLPQFRDLFKIEIADSRACSESEFWGFLGQVKLNSKIERQIFVDGFVLNR